MTNSRTLFQCSLLMSILLLLSGCAPLDWIKEKMGGADSGQTCPAVSGASSESDEVLASENGNILITKSQFDKQFNNFVEKHPLGQVLKQTDGFKSQFLNGLVSQKLISKDIHERGIDTSKEYLDDLEQLKAMLDARYFEMNNQSKLSDAEVKAYYDQKKESIPAAIISRGGVAAMGVEFAKEADAKAFLEKVKGKGADFAKIAKDAKVEPQDFKLVNQQSVGLDPALRDKILGFSKFPAFEVVPAGGKYWVIYAASKEQAKYRPFDQVKAAVQEMAQMEKQREAFEKGVEELKKKYNVTINDAALENMKKSEPVGDEMQAQEQLAKLMPAKNEGKPKAS